MCEAFIMDGFIVDEKKFIELRSTKENEIVFAKSDRKIIFENFEFDLAKNVEVERIFINLIYKNNVTYPFPMIINPGSLNNHNDDEIYTAKYSFSLINVEKLIITSNNPKPIKAYYYFENDN